MALMMKCGCAANAQRVMPDDTRIPCCVIHQCIEVADAPDLTERKARCGYYGKSIRQGFVRGSCECSRCKGKPTCGCEVPSSTNLAFFSSRPNEPFDSFYCGCFGWD